MKELQCATCGAAIKTGKYCSKPCFFKSQEKRVDKICRHCAREYQVQINQSLVNKFCSKKCYAQSMLSRVKRSCLTCAKVFYVKTSVVNKGGGKYCCFECYSIAASKNKMGEGNPLWKGDDVGYGALHTWVKTALGRPSKCEHCGTTKAQRFEWANKSGKYLRDLTDWIRLCKKCHHAYDDLSTKLWRGRREGKISNSL